VKDYLVKAIAHNKQVRAYAAITTETIEEARRRHDMLAVSSVVLGRSMTAGVILGAMLKGEEKLTIKMNGGGPIGTILVEANAKGEVRGYVSNPHANGILSVTKDIGLYHPFMARFPLLRVKSVRILPLIYCIQNKSLPLLV
jgi:molecular chaperone Hsp33